MVWIVTMPGRSLRQERCRPAFMHELKESGIHRRWKCRRVGRGQLVIPNRLITERYRIIAADAAEIFHDGIRRLELFEKKFPVLAKQHDRGAGRYVPLDTWMVEYRDEKPRLLVALDDNLSSPLIYQGLSLIH